MHFTKAAKHYAVKRNEFHRQRSGNRQNNMNHGILSVLELSAGVVLIIKYLAGPYLYREAERWAMKAVLCAAVAFLLDGMMGAMIYWHLVRISSHQSMVAVSARSGIGGIAVGILLSLLLSGQMQKLFVVNRSKRQEE